jgi:hypothetical protein
MEREQRVENILLSLRKCDYLTRSQIQRIHNLKGDRNANRVLKSMEEYLGSFRHGLEKVYHLNKAGRERVAATQIRKKTPNVQHFILRNQLWISLGRPRTWENEYKVKAGEVSLVCDAKFTTKGGIPVFVEVDVTQPMIKNSAKISKYKKLKETTDDPFHVVWITEIESRRAKLTDLMKGLPGKIFTLKETL